MVITKITAAPIPADVSTFLDTPRNGQSPRNWLNTTLFTRPGRWQLKVILSSIHSSYSVLEASAPFLPLLQESPLSAPALLFQLLPSLLLPPFQLPPSSLLPFSQPPQLPSRQSGRGSQSMQSLAVKTVASADKLRALYGTICSRRSLKLVLQCLQNRKYEESTWSQNKDGNAEIFRDKGKSK